MLCTSILLTSPPDNSINTSNIGIPDATRIIIAFLRGPPLQTEPEHGAEYRLSDRSFSPIVQRTRTPESLSSLIAHARRATIGSAHKPLHFPEAPAERCSMCL